MPEWYEIKNVSNLDTPALVVYPARVKKNIALAIEIAGDVNRLRPHVKTNKAAAASGLMLDAGIHKFKCATIAEAEMLAMTGAPDVLLAYQPVGPKVRRFISLVLEYPGTRFSCVVDNKMSAGAIASEAHMAGITIPVYLDLNVGMNRTGISPGQEALDLYEQCKNSEGLIPVGLHLYDGHIRDADLEARQKKCDEAFSGVEWLNKEIIKKGFEEPVIIAGGSPSFPVHANRGGVECSPGTFIYWDAGYLANYKEQDFLPAALVVTRIISLPDSTTICTDLGHKSIAAENPLANRVRFLNVAGLEPVGQSEEHLVLKAPASHSFKVGDVLYGMPYHICPTCALYERAWIIEDGEVSGEWKIAARDRKINI